MIRFVPIGSGRVHLVEAVAHDRAAAEQVVSKLDLLRPARVHIDLWPAASEALARGASTLGGPADVIGQAMESIEGCEAHVLHRRVVAWARQNGAHVGLLLPTLRLPRRRDVKALQALLMREGLHAQEAQRAVDEVRAQVLPRIPALADWEAGRRAALEASLRALWTQGGSGFVVVAYPDGEAIADAVQGVGAGEGADVAG